MCPVSNARATCMHSDKVGDSAADHPTSISSSRADGARSIEAAHVANGSRHQVVGDQQHRLARPLDPKQQGYAECRETAQQATGALGGKGAPEQRLIEAYGVGSALHARRGSAGPRRPCNAG